MALFAHVKWRESTKLVFAKMHVVIVDGGTIEEFLLGAQGLVPHYLRFDFDLSALGQMFTHPQPHIHASSEKVFARFPVDPISGNVVPEFLDFLYRNYFSVKWIAWAREVWRRGNQGEEAPFAVVEDAFKKGKHGILMSQYPRELARMKRVWQQQRDRYPLRVPGPVAALNYALPEAH